MKGLEMYVEEPTREELKDATPEDVVYRAADHLRYERRPRCRTCRHYTPSRTSLGGEPPDWTYPTSDYGDCRRYPATPLLLPQAEYVMGDTLFDRVISRFPYVFETQWCGEHDPIPQAETDATALALAKAYLEGDPEALRALADRLAELG